MRNIERQLRTALDSGATRPQLEQAIETARTVQENAARIHLREAERRLGAFAPPVTASENEAESGDGCPAGPENRTTRGRSVLTPRTRPARSRRSPSPPAETNDPPTAADAAGPCRKEA